MCVYMPVYMCKHVHKGMELQMECIRLYMYMHMHMYMYIHVYMYIRIQHVHPGDQGFGECTFAFSMCIRAIRVSVKN